MSSGVFQADGSTLGRIKEAGGRRFGNLPSSLSLFCLSHTPPVCFPPSLSSLLPLSAFHHNSLSVHGTRGKSSGFMMFYSNEKRHGDSAVLAQRPHLLSLLLLCISVCVFHSLCSSLSLYMLPTVSEYKITFTTYFATPIRGDYS